MRLFALGFIFLFSCASVYGWTDESCRNALGHGETTGTILPVQPLVRFYRDRISVHDGGRCMFYPTCSEFFSEAARMHGLFWAVLMTADRMLYRENARSTVHYEEDPGTGRYRDPVNHNFIFRSVDYCR